MFYDSNFTLLEHSGIVIEKTLKYVTGIFFFVHLNIEVVMRKCDFTFFRIDFKILNFDHT